MSNRDNPYESPKSSATVLGERRASWLRGIVAAAILGACGFAVPYAVLGSVLLLRMTLTDMHPFDRAADLRELPAKGMGAAIACSLVFAFAALAHFTPRRGAGLVRSLIVMGGVAIVAVFVTGIAGFAAGVRPSHDTYELLGWLGLAVFSVFLCAGGVVFAVWQIRKSDEQPDLVSLPPDEEAGSANSRTPNEGESLCRD